MPTTPTQRRQNLRRVLTSNECVNPASVFDPISARIAERLGYEAAVLPGSVAAAVVLGVPDIVLLTLDDLVGLARRIARYSDISLIADADHGYGNALNTMRTVEELEAAGIAGLTLEDTILPDRFAEGEGMISVREMSGKLKAATKARVDPSLVIVARTNGLRSSNLADSVERLKAYADTGVDAVMVVGVRTPAEVDAIHQAVKLPLIVGNVANNAPPELVDRKLLAAKGVRLAYQGQAPYMASLKAMEDAMKHLRSGGAIGALSDKVATDAFFNDAVRRDLYAGLKKDFMS